MFAAMRRASSRVNRLAAARRPGSFLEIDEGKCLLVRVPDNEAWLRFFDGPGRLEAACGHFTRHSTPSNASASRNDVTTVTDATTTRL
jgi:hypothetical protein